MGNNNTASSNISADDNDNDNTCISPGFSSNTGTAICHKNNYHTHGQAATAGLSMTPHFMITVRDMPYTVTNSFKR